MPQCVACTHTHTLCRQGKARTRTWHAMACVATHAVSSFGCVRCLYSEHQRRPCGTRLPSTAQPGTRHPLPSSLASPGGQQKPPSFLPNRPQPSGHLSTARVYASSEHIVCVHTHKYTQQHVGMPTNPRYLCAGGQRAKSCSCVWLAVNVYMMY